ncbi:unnamed protein product [Leptosia nina]|uniref:Uncharacterized protein n=1 Tax=Leptosia nina TaxID=320188 RepID=A0AAV1JUS4_9NEOP
MGSAWKSDQKILKVVNFIRHLSSLLIVDWRAPMTDESEAARRGRGVPPAPPPRLSIRPEPKPRSAPPRLIRPSEHLAMVEQAMAERAMDRRPPAPLVPSVTVLHGPRPAPPLPPAPRQYMPPPTRMPAPVHPVMRLPQPPRNPQNGDAAILCGYESDSLLSHGPRKQ